MLGAEDGITLGIGEGSEVDSSDWLLVCSNDGDSEGLFLGDSLVYMMELHWSFSILPWRKLKMTWSRDQHW